MVKHNVQQHWELCKGNHVRDPEHDTSDMKYLKRRSTALGECHTRWAHLFQWYLRTDDACSISWNRFLWNIRWLIHLFATSVETICFSRDTRRFESLQKVESTAPSYEISKAHRKPKAFNCHGERNIRVWVVYVKMHRITCC